MKIIQQITLFEGGKYFRSQSWKKLWRLLLTKIKEIDWPEGAGKFKIYPQSGKKRGEGNGVTPIKLQLMKKLKNCGWSLEQPIDIASNVKVGNFDAVYNDNDRLIALEWETGNISSSHRSLNKMALGIYKEIISVGILIVPSREMYKYLTDRVGNITELMPYFDLWKAIKYNEGILKIIVIEHDATSESVPRIPKGTDGRAIN